MFTAAAAVALSFVFIGVHSWLSEQDPSRIIRVSARGSKLATARGGAA